MRLQLTEPQKNLQQRARAARNLLVAPFRPAKEFENMAAYGQYLGQRMSEIGSTLLGRPLTPEICSKKDFMEITKIMLTLQASWKDNNDQGVELLTEGFGQYVESGSIKEFKYGGTPETGSQLQAIRRLLERQYPDRAQSYLDAWRSDIAIDSFWTTDHLLDWLTMGKVCGGSCQSYDGSPYWNKSLGGPIFALDKLGFTGRERQKATRSLIVPTPVIGKDEKIELAIIVPSAYSINGKLANLIDIIKGALYAAGISGAQRVGFLFEDLNGISLADAFNHIRDKEITVEFKNREGETVRSEVIIPRVIGREACTILSMKGPNSYKYWDYAGGMVDYERAENMMIEGVNVAVEGLETHASFIEFERKIAA
jgi:hypothetical protein